MSRQVPAELAPGVHMKLCYGKYDSFPSFDHLMLAAFGIQDKLGFDFPVTENLGYEFEAYWNVPESGSYHFELGSQDGSRLFVDDEVIVNNGGIHDYQVKTGSVELKEGWHRIKLQYFRCGQGLRLDCFVKGPGLPRVNLADAGLSIDAELIRELAARPRHREA